jgi:hypothetical protein
MDADEVTAEIGALGSSPDHYVVMGGASLAIRGLSRGEHGCIRQGHRRGHE